MLCFILVVASFTHFEWPLLGLYSRQAARKGLECDKVPYSGVLGVLLRPFKLGLASLFEPSLFESPLSSHILNHGIEHIDTLSFEQDVASFRIFFWKILVIDVWGGWFGGPDERFDKCDCCGPGTDHSQVDVPSRMSGVSLSYNKAGARPPHGYGKHSGAKPRCYGREALDIGSAHAQGPQQILKLPRV